MVKIIFSTAGLSAKRDKATGQKEANDVFESSFKGYGYLTATASAALLKLEFFPLMHRYE